MSSTSTMDSVAVLSEAFEQSMEHLRKAQEASSDVVVTHALTPEAVYTEFPEVRNLGPDARGSMPEVAAMFEKVLKLSVNTSCKRFCNQLYAEPDPVGLAAAQVVSMANCSLATFEMSPVFSTCERELVTRLLGRVGWDPSQGEGIFCPGGSHCNHTAMLAARNAYEPDSKSGGCTLAASGKGPLVAFASKNCHYSVQKGANLIGIGQDSNGGLVTIDTDENGCMRVDALRAAIAEAVADGKRPFLVVGTAGTTVRGAYDPILAISGVCKEYGMWLHIDGALGGSLVFSKTRRHLLEGLELADSLTWDAHKMLGVPLQCAVLLLRNRHLHASNSTTGKYLFKVSTLKQMEATEGDRFGTIGRELAEQKANTGDSSLQCGRLADSFKWWAMWFVHGEDWFVRRVEKLEVLRQRFIANIEASSTLHLAAAPEGLNVLFYALPQYLLSADGKPNLSTPEFVAKAAHASQATRKMLLEEGKWMVNYQETQDTLAPCLRMVFLNPALTELDIDELCVDISSVLHRHFETAKLDGQQGAQSLGLLEAISKMASTGLDAPRAADANIETSKEFAENLADSASTGSGVSSTEL